MNQVKISLLTRRVQDLSKHVPNWVVNDNLLLGINYVVVVVDWKNPIMIHVEDLSVESEDNMFDQMTMDW